MVRSQKTFFRNKTLSNDRELTLVSETSEWRNVVTYLDLLIDVSNGDFACSIFIGGIYLIFILSIFLTYPGFLLGTFSWGVNLLVCKFLLLCYCFRTKFQGGANVFRGANRLRGRPHPLWNKASIWEYSLGICTKILPLPWGFAFKLLPGEGFVGVAPEGQAFVYNRFFAIFGILIIIARIGN